LSEAIPGGAALVVPAQTPTAKVGISMLGGTRFLAVLLATSAIAAGLAGGSAGPGGGAETDTSEEDDGGPYGY
jgi:hypothetical protein